VLRNAESGARVRELEARLRQREFTVRQAVAVGDVPAATAAREDLEFVREECELARDPVNGLVVVSPIDGRILTHDVANLVGSYVDQGDQLLEVGDTRTKSFVAVLSQSQADSIAADDEVDGVAIGARESVTILLSSANRDPAANEDPDRFDIARPEIRHLSFGGGAHLCLGAHLARIEAQEAIGALVARYPKLRKADAPEVWKQVPSFRGLEEFRVRID